MTGSVGSESNYAGRGQGATAENGTIDTGGTEATLMMTNLRSTQMGTVLGSAATAMAIGTVREGIGMMMMRMTSLSGHLYLRLMMPLSYSRYTTGQ